MLTLFAITFLSLASSNVSYQEQMARELQELNSYLQQQVPVEVPPPPKIILPQPEENIVDLYEKIGKETNSD